MERDIETGMTLYGGEGRKQKADSRYCIPARGQRAGSRQQELHTFH
jgi:hypothetical protein